MGNRQSQIEKTGRSVSENPRTPVNVPPLPFLTLEEFFKTWFSWKENFLTYKSMNNNAQKQWGNVLLNLMGPVAHDIYNTFTFISPQKQDNLEILLQKFDEYCIFGTRKRLPRENVYEYIMELQSIVQQKNLENEEEIIKEKISREISEPEYTRAARIFIPDFIFLRDYKNLTLKEAAFFWKIHANNEKANCKSCGNHHDKTSCPAINKECSNCNKKGHLDRRCPTVFIFNCHSCGDCHYKRRCPAFKEICSNCKKENHFAWKCKPKTEIKCRNCNTCHAFSRQICPAYNSYCSNCKKIGHLTSKCNNRFQKKINN